MGFFGDLVGAAAGAMANAVKERKAMQLNLFGLLDSGNYCSRDELYQLVEDYDSGTSNYNLKRISREMQRKYDCTYGDDWIVGRIKFYLEIDD